MKCILHYHPYYVGSWPLKVVPLRGHKMSLLWILAVSLGGSFVAFLQELFARSACLNEQTQYSQVWLTLWVVAFWRRSSEIRWGMGCLVLIIHHLRMSVTYCSWNRWSVSYFWWVARHGGRPRICCAGSVLIEASLPLPCKNIARGPVSLTLC